MAEAGRYAQFLGTRVEAYYRASDMQMCAAGILVADTGKSIFIEERFSQSGKPKTLRVEIPYNYIVRVVKSNGDPPNADHSANSSK